MDETAERPVKGFLKTLILDGLKVYVYVEMFDNAYFTMISKQGVKLGTLVLSLTLPGGLTRSTTLLGWRGGMQARILAEKISRETGLMTLLSVNLEEESLQRNFHKILDVLNECLKNVKA